MKVIRVGVDLDGVIAQHSLGGFWFKLRKFKERVLRRTHSPSYYFPETFVERNAWIIIDWLRQPFKERNLLLSLAKDKKIKFYLITGRFKFLERLTIKWLKRNKLFNCFEKVLINTDNLEPTKFKAQKINQLDLNFFIDDDLDTILALKKKTPAKLYWLMAVENKEINDSRVIPARSLVEALKQIVLATEVFLK